MGWGRGYLREFWANWSHRDTFLKDSKSASCSIQTQLLKHCFKIFILTTTKLLALLIFHRSDDRFFGRTASDKERFHKWTRNHLPEYNPPSERQKELIHELAPIKAL